MKEIIRFTLNDKTVEMFPYYAEEIYELTIEDDKVVVSWTEDGEIETNTHYSLEDVNEFFNDGSWKRF